MGGTFRNHSAPAAVRRRLGYSLSLLMLPAVLGFAAGGCEADSESKPESGARNVTPSDEPKSGLTFSGVIVDNLTGKPLSGAQVQLTLVGGVRAAPARSGYHSGKAPRGTHVRRDIKSHDTLTGSSGEFVITGIDMPANSRAFINTFDGGHAHTFKELSVEEIKSGSTHPVRIAVHPFTHTEEVPPDGEISTPDQSIRIELPDALKCNPKCTGVDDPALSEPQKVFVDISVADPTRNAALLPGKSSVNVVTICHAPKGTGSTPKTLVIPEPALESHLGHGDKVGPCEGAAASTEAPPPFSLEPVALAHFSLRNESNEVVSNVVTPETPAQVVIALPDALQEKYLKKVEQGESHAEAFHLDERTGDLVGEGPARLVVVEEPITPGSKEKKKKVYAETEVTHACTVMIAALTPTVCMQGQVETPDGQPAPDVWVRGAAIKSKAIHHARTDASGRYQIDAPERDSVILSASHIKKEIILEGEEVTGKLLHTELGGTSDCLNGPDLKVAEPTILTGIVLDASGDPAVGVVVTSEGTSAAIEADGTFSVAVEGDAGTLRIVTQSGDGAVSTVIPIVIEETGTTEPVGTVTLAPVTTLTGAVTDDETGEPIAGAVVSAAGNQTVTDIEGEYALAVPSTAESVELTIEAVTENGVTVSETTVVPVDGSTAVQVPEQKLETEEACIVGRVVDVSGKGLRGAFVQVQDSNILTTDAEGRFEGTAARREKIKFQARFQDGESGEDFKLDKSADTSSAGGCAEVTFNLDNRPAFVQGYVTRGSGAPVFGEPRRSPLRAPQSSGTPLAGVSVASSLGGSAVTDGTGRYKISVRRESDVTLVFSLGTVLESVTFTTGKRGAVTPLDVQLDIEDAPPLVESVTRSNPSVKPGGAVRVTIEVSDDRGGMTYKVGELESGSVLNPTGAVAPDGTITLDVVAPTETGTIEIPVTITDSGGNEAEITPSIEIRTNNEAPTIAAMESTTLAPLSGETVSVSAAASDADGDALSHDWTLTTEDGKDLTHLLLDPTDDTAAFITPELAEGTGLILEVTVTDSNGNEDTQTIALEIGDGAGRPSREEILAGETKITSDAPKVSNKTEQTIDLPATEPGTTLRCSLDGSTAVPCTEAVTYDRLKEGTHSITVETIDASGENIAAPLTYTLEVDTTPPTVTVPEPVPSEKNTGAIEIPVSTSDPETVVECSLDGGPYRVCAPPVTFANLPDGDHTCKLRAVDDAGNVSEEQVEVKWTVDQTPPAFAGVKSATSNGSGQVDLAWDPASDNRSALADITYEICKTTTPLGCCGNGFTPQYTSPAGATSYSVGSLTPGTRHRFVVRAKDKAGNVETNQVEQSAVAP